MLKLLLQKFTVIALNFDHTVLHSTAAATASLEDFGESVELLCREWQPIYQCYTFAIAPLGLAANPDDSIFCRNSCLLALALAGDGRVSTTRTETA